MTAPANAGTTEATRKRTLIDELYRRYSQALRRFLARQRLGRDEVADIVQETYYRLHRCDSVEQIRNPRAFLFRVALNVLLNARKHRGKGIEEAAFVIEGVEIASDEPGPHRSFDGEQELAIVSAAFEELAPKCRAAFIMNRFDNMSFSEIARELDLSVSMIEKHVSHAIAHMRKRLNERQALPDRARIRALK